MAVKTQLRKAATDSFVFCRRVARACGYRGRHFTHEVRPEDFFVQPNLDLNQFFFDTQSTEAIVSAFDHHKAICCFCAPRLAHTWTERGKPVALLDADRRFGHLPGYQYYDLRNPAPVAASYDLIIGDPPFTVSAKELRVAVDAMAARSPDVTLCFFFPIGREKELLAAFAGCDLRRISVRNLRWNNIKESHHCQYGFYSNTPLQSDLSRLPSARVAP